MFILKYLNNRMKQTEHLPSIFVLYSEKDEEYKDALSVYFKALQSRGVFEKIEYHKNEKQAANWWLDAIQKWDVIVLLISIHLVNGNSYASFLNKLKTENNLNRIFLAPILLQEAMIDLKTYENILIFPYNQQGLKSGFWLEKDNFYKAVFEQLEAFLWGVIEFKAKHEKYWRRAKLENTVDSYLFFQEEYPHSKYVKLARENRDKLIEKKLWEQANGGESVQDYYEYLVNTPLNYNRREAALKINETEKDEDLIWKEIQESGQLEDLFRYRISYPKGRYRWEAGRLIEKKLAQQSLIEYKFSRETSTRFLIDLAYSNLRPSEIYSMETFAKFIEHMEFQIKETREKFELYIPLTTSGAVFMVCVCLAVTIYPGALLSKMLPLVILVGLTYKAIRGAIFHKKDREYIMRAIDHLKHLGALLKVYTNVHDSSSKLNLIRLLYSIERAILEIKHKKIFEYYLQKKAIEPIDMGKYLPGPKK